MLYKVILTFESVDETRKCDNSYESFWVILSCGLITLYMVVLTFESMRETLRCDYSKPNAQNCQQKG